MSSQDLNLYNRRGVRPANSPESAAQGPTGSEEQIRVDGFGQVLSLLQVADAPFRDSLLRRLAARDPELARNLRAMLAKG